MDTSPSAKRLLLDALNRMIGIFSTPINGPELLMKAEEFAALEAKAKTCGFVAAPLKLHSARSGPMSNSEFTALLAYMPDGQNADHFGRPLIYRHAKQVTLRSIKNENGHAEPWPGLAPITDDDRAEFAAILARWTEATELLSENAPPASAISQPIIDVPLAARALGTTRQNVHRISNKPNSPIPKTSGGIGAVALVKFIACRETPRREERDDHRAMEETAKDIESAKPRARFKCNITGEFFDDEPGLEKCPCCGMEDWEAAAPEKKTRR